MLSNVPWSHYEAELAVRGESAVPRMAYLDGVLELTTPSRGHERTKSLIGCLVEAYAIDREILFMPYGGWTLKAELKKAGLEPDECYILGADQDRDRPDLAIEVIWTSRSIDKLEIHRRLKIGEVWFWQDGELSVHVLDGGSYRRVGRSPSFPELDLAVLCTFLDRRTVNEAVRDFRAALAARDAR
ncbi:MAG TPA: Uma2 family endonuclease [Kofleriaceae bacterium]|nr:Uma2 family endonuclease [Kofleriaceae bacterium]